MKKILTILASLSTLVAGGAVAADSHQLISPGVYCLQNPAYSHNARIVLTLNEQGDTMGYCTTGTMYFRWGCSGWDGKEDKAMMTFEPAANEDYTKYRIDFKYKIGGYFYPEKGEFELLGDNVLNVAGIYKKCG